MKLDVLAPGVLTTVQDRGRVGWRHVGVALAGALDVESAALANRLAGNPDGAAVLELTLHGPTLRLPRPVRIAIFGAAVQARDGRRVFVRGQPQEPFVAVTERVRLSQGGEVVPVHLLDFTGDGRVERQ